MSKRFNNVGSYLYDGDEPIGSYEDVSIRGVMVELLNMLHEENQSLKAQLHCPFDSICAICSNEYLVQKDKHDISKCRKGHEQCSKIDVLYCYDFEKGDVE